MVEIMKVKKYKLLLIEDNKLDRMAFKRFIETAGLPYDYTVAGSASQALEILESEQFDVIISDYSLGDGTALDILDFAKNIPIIVVTAADAEETAVNAWKAGAYDYIAKDFGLDYLQAIPRIIESAVNRKKIEDALNRKQKNLEAIFDAVPVGMLLADENMMITRVNDTIRQKVHRDYPQIIDRQIGGALGCVNSTQAEKGCGHVPACSQCLFQQAIESVLDTGRSVRNLDVHPTLKINGEQVTPWFRMSTELATIDARKHVVIALDDITERKKAERELRSVQDRYRMIFENSAVAITMADEDERLVSWNRFTETLLGMNRDDLYLKSVKSLYPDREWDKIRTCNIRQKGMQHHLETRMIRKDGTEIDVDISLRVLKNAEEGHTVSIGVIRDIGERKRAEAKQAQLLDEVENINKELCDFASIVSHDLKAPLRGIRTLADWIVEDYADKLGQEGTEQMKLLVSRVERMHELIEGVLDYSSVGRTGEERVPVDLNVLVPEAVDLLAPPEGIVIEIENELPTVECERTRLAQVFQNLLGNAIKYMDKVQGRIRVGCAGDGDFWEFSVADNVPGIKEKHFEKVFQIFQTVSSGHDGESTGVGLTVVKKIIELYGGKIRIESEYGEGSTFFFTLPKRKTEVGQRKLEANSTC